MKPIHPPAMEADTGLLGVPYANALSRRGLFGLSGALAVSGAIGTSGQAASADDPIAGIVRRAMEQGPFPGIVVAVQKGDRMLYRQGFGYVDLENRVAATPEAVFPIGSVTKTMTGLAIMQLVAQGRIALDDAAGRYIDGLPAPVAALRIRNLADHSAGLVGYLDAPGFPRKSQDPITRQQVVDWFAKQPLQFEPGTRWSYSNSGIYLLGLIIEKISGLGYDRYLQENIFAPFGMANSSITGWETLQPRRAHGYKLGRNGLENAQRYDPLVAFSAGAVLSTVDDMLKYRRGVFGDGPTSPAVRKLILQRDRLKSGTLLPYSLGCLAVADFERHRKIGHPGDIFGFSSQYAYYPDDDVTIIVLSNIQYGGISIVSVEQKIARVVLGLPQPVIVDAPLSAADAARFSGSYALGEIRFAVDAMRFAVKDGGLQVGFVKGGESGPGIPLRYQGKGEFVSAYDDEQRFRFESAGAQRRVFMTAYGSVFAAVVVS
jgi:D-alanyl-D-alanine carboxypeptidase